MLGKRARARAPAPAPAPLSRTTSMKEINVEGSSPLDEPQVPVAVGSSWLDHRPSVLLSPRWYMGDHHHHHQNQRLETASFLRTCGLCNRRLSPGRDIYIYKGDAAFCSEECRAQRIKQDERIEQCTVAKSKKVESHHNNNHLQRTSNGSTKNQTVAAA